MMGEACCLCGGSRCRPYLSRVYVLGERTFDLVRCLDCGLVRVEPMLEPGEARALYTHKYFEQDFSLGVRSGSYLETEGSRVEEYREILEAIRKHCPAGRFLEVGCAAGSFLNYARRIGYEVEGVDVSEWAAATAREQFGLTVRVGRLVEAGLPEGSFDVVFLGDLLEHEPEPIGFLAEVKRVTRPGGLVAIKVPTYVNSFYYRTARRLPISWTLGRLDNRLLAALKLGGDAPTLPPYHLYEYSLPTLSRICEKTGLRVLGHRTSLLVPEFLGQEGGRWPDRAADLGFRLLRALVRRFNLPAGHVLVFAAAEKT